MTETSLDILHHRSRCKKNLTLRTPRDVTISESAPRNKPVEKGEKEKQLHPRRKRVWKCVDHIKTNNHISPCFNAETRSPKVIAHRLISWRSVQLAASRPDVCFFFRTDAIRLPFLPKTARIRIRHGTNRAFRGQMPNSETRKSKHLLPPEGHKPAGKSRRRASCAP